MVVNFAKIDLHKRPNFIVRNFDGTALAVLGHILKPAADIRYNEISEIKFEYGRYLYHAFQIKYNAINAEVEFWSPAYAYAYWMFERTTFSGYVDFSDATVLGLDATAKFG